MVFCAPTCGKWPDFNKCSLPLSSSVYQTVTIMASFHACEEELEEPGPSPSTFWRDSPFRAVSAHPRHTQAHTHCHLLPRTAFISKSAARGSSARGSYPQRRRTRPSRKRSRWHVRADTDRFSGMRERTGEVRGCSCGNRQYQVGRAPSQPESG